MTGCGAAILPCRLFPEPHEAHPRGARHRGPDCATGAGAGREVADGAPIHLPPEPGDGSIGCPLLGSERTQEDGLVGQLTKGGKACR